jgi:prolyl oligopeptidase
MQFDPHLRTYISEILLLLFYHVNRSQSGSDWVKIHVKSTVDGATPDLEDKPLEWAKFTSISWTHDDKGYFYTRYKKPQTVSDDKAGTETDESKNQMLCYHRIGTPQEEDVLCMHAVENPEHMFGVSVSPDGRYVILRISESCDPKNLVYVCDLKEQFGDNVIDGEKLCFRREVFGRLKPLV